MQVESNAGGISFEEVRGVLLVLLGDVGEEFWRGKLAGVAEHNFGSLLGGMGSFSDLVISRGNGHRVGEEKEPLANELLLCLTEVCFLTSKQGALRRAEAVAACGTDRLELSGARCLECGYARVSYFNLRAFIAAVEVREGLMSGADLAGLWRAEEDVERLKGIAGVALGSGINTSVENQWMRPCAGCGGEETAVYRWWFENGLFVPLADNLPMKVKKEE